LVKRDKLFNRAKNNAAGLRFEEACQLAEQYGWVFYHQVGSHRQYRRPGFARSVNLQPDKNGMAKVSQVRDLVAKIEALHEDLSGDGEQQDE